MKAGILWERKCLEAALQSYERVTEIDRSTISAWTAQSKILVELH